ncbi:putative ribonuclease H-like domain-containing protein [Tanacetum coccineum]
MNLKLLRSLPSEWKTHALIWRNKVEIETISLDDLHNNLKIYEQELTGSASTSQNLQNVAFVSNSTNSTNNINKADNTAYEVSTAHTQGNGVNSTSLDNLCDAVICAFLASQPNSPQLAQEDLEQLHPDDLEEMDLQWEMAMLTIRARRFIKRTCRKLDINGQRVGFDKSKVKCYNCHKNGHFSRECRFLRNQENKDRENNTRTITVETPTQNDLIAQDGIGGYDWSYQAKEEQPTNYALMACTSLGSLLVHDSVVDFVLKQYNALDEYKMKLDKAEKERDRLKQTLKKFQNSSKSLNDLLERNFIPRKPDLTFIDEIVKSENMDVTTVVTPSNDKTIENKGVSNIVETNVVRMNNSSAPIIEDWNSDDESEIDYTVRPSTEKIKSIKTVRETDAPKQNKHHPRGNQRNWNNLMSQRLGSDFKMINKACYVCGSFEHLHYVCDKKVVRPVWNNSRRVNHKNFSNKMTHPHPKRSFVPQAVLTRTGKINTTGANVNTTGDARGRSKSIMLDPQKSLILLFYMHGNPQQKEYTEKAVIDSGCSRHLTGNKCYLDEYEDYDGGFVSFGDGKDKIYGKDKGHFYSVDLKSVFPTGGLTCLIAKATIDESNTWHRRLGHINFKTMNKLVKGNLVKGLPLKIFVNDHSCVACQKRKQHKASYTTKLVNSISKPLHMLHMDLFGPINVKSLMKKSYCLVITDDFSRFSWVFFFATKDETSGILKTFITKIENQLDHKVKVIRCDNGTKFKNSIMNQFCEMKGIKREFSVARTPQHNGVAERKNKTLIEAAKTMLVDSKLPTTFWAEAVNTACYVLNRVLVIKPHNKTPYELIRGRPPLINFMKIFRYPVTILNTSDHLGKFDGKADEGYFVGYSVVSKVMRVFNKRTRIVEETLNITFLENAPNVKGNGPDWLFDVDSLTISMNYVPVVAGNQTNGITGTKDNIVAGQAQKEKDLEQEYILIPLFTTDPLISQGPKDNEGDAGMKPTEVDERGASDKNEKDA